MNSTNTITSSASALIILLALLFLSTARATAAAASVDGERQTYIVHVLPQENLAVAGDEELESWYRSFLPITTTTTTTTADSDASRLIYSYRDVISGFAARLTKEEVDEMKKKPGFVSAYPDRRLSLATTHTPDFLGLQRGNGFWGGSGGFGKGVIIGVFDSGFTPGHPSFDDNGMPPPPKRWKGVCDFNFCNNKIIGARAFNDSGDKLPLVDEDGHGTHTASTAAGNFVNDADALGNANGTAAGMAPHAHLAIYSVCGIFYCSSAAILAGVDAAISDGVDVISMSIGGQQIKLDIDPIAIAAFAATQRGIFVSCAAGNQGPRPRTLSNEAPWILTVAASTMDRNIRATVKLGNGEQLNGESLFQPKNFTSSFSTLVYPFNCDSLTDVKGKVVMCEGNGDGVAEGDKVKSQGGVAMIFMNTEFQGYTTFAQLQVLPASHVSYADGLKIISYLNSTKNPTATIVFNGTILGASPAPTITYFSSRGPNFACKGILKPDITGPGLNVLGAWHTQVGPASAGKKNFNLMSGTSASTPHLSGIAALIKSAHPDWSPAAIKSAIMTTSDDKDHAGGPIKNELFNAAGFFATGAGHVNPSRAADPGLVYDVDFNDYISYLCRLGLGDSGVGVFVRRNISCSDFRNITGAELNYPSILVHPRSGQITVNRTVTNVGEANSTYTAEVEVPERVRVTVKPEMMHFTKVNEKKSFTVTVRWSNSTKSSEAAEGNLRWVSHKHVVRSPIAVVS